ncbi:hypothetical protein AQUCO_01400857v1 [Aquilegia coerulea]|uniref:Uncharacterized protein n=1 Tax=Aquilegia coerulea TaxID=218851 RepID=A0A2G5DYF6_AQUCA|nr:hypothetical protein AQUCO_01400857v1 [Aquilegia coerulea]
MMLESGLGDMLMKVGMFLLVQALVYFILTSSSNVFSNNINMRSVSFKTARSVSVRRIMAAISDLPLGGEPSPRSPRPTRTSSYEPY